MTSIFFRTAIIYVLLSISMKVMGKREIGELEVGELITTLLISEICSIPIDDQSIPLMNAVIPVLLIVSLEIILSHLKNKSLKLKRAFDGNTVTLISHGKLNQRALKENRISLEEFFCALRQNGIGEIGEIEHCLLEANGKISVLKKNNMLDKIIISDGEINQKALRDLGYDEVWIHSRIGKRKPSDIFLMTVNDEGNTYIILKEEQ